MQLSETAEAAPANPPEHERGTPEPVDILILGAGWTSKFLIPLLTEEKVSWAATSTTGRDGTIPFRFDPASDSPEPYRALPTARTVLVTFPLKGEGQSRRLTSLYLSSRAATTAPPNWVQLGSTGIFTAPTWNDEASAYDAANPRAVAEDELMACADGCVLNLAGLYDSATRDPRNWVTRVARSKEAVRAKGALHLVHGVDVARAVLAVHRRFTPRRRWIVADIRSYDWWDLIQAWGAEARLRLRAGASGSGPGADAGAEIEELRYEQWVAELMQEEEVRALPRPVEKLGRVLDSRAFWRQMGIWPVMGRVS